MMPLGVDGAVHVSEISEKTGLVARTLRGAEGAGYKDNTFKLGHNYYKPNIPSSLVLTVTVSLAAPTATVTASTKME